MYQIYKYLKILKLTIQWFFKKKSFEFEAEYMGIKNESNEDDRKKTVGRAMLERENIIDSFEVLKKMIK